MGVARQDVAAGIVFRNEIAKVHGVIDEMRHSPMVVRGHAVAQGVVGVMPLVGAAGHADQTVLVVVGVDSRPRGARFLDQVAIEVICVRSAANGRVLIEVVGMVFLFDPVDASSNPVAERVVFVDQILIRDGHIGGAQHGPRELACRVVGIGPGPVVGLHRGAPTTAVVGVGKARKHVSIRQMIDQ